MRVYLSVDMEGVAGVVHEDQTNPFEPRFGADYERARRLMTEEANAAILGALDAGATGIVVNDSHWHTRNILPEQLHERAELLSGGPKRWSMMEGVDGGFDAALCIGYHARAGTAPATIDHTWTDRVHEVRLNGRPVGELGLNAALAGSFGVPVALVSGDQALAREAREWLGEAVETVVVKHAVARYAARSLHPVRARELIREGTAAALSRRHEPLVIAGGVTLEVEFARSQMADMAELVPGAERRGGRTVVFASDDFQVAFRAWRAMYNLAGME